MLDAILLGIIQGLTEFLPISSSGHLVLGEELLGFMAGERHDVLLEVVLHLGTLLAVVVAYWQDLKALVLSLLPAKADPEAATQRARSRRLILLLIVGSVPAALVGLLLKEQITSLFSEPRVVASLLLVTAAILFIGDRIQKRDGAAEESSWLKSLLIGAAQAFAILPGISRSGSTIVTGLLLGLRPIEAARFSFLLSIPAVGGAALLEFKDLLESTQPPALDAPTLIAGFAASAIVGYLALQWLLVAVERRNLSWFALYCLIIGSLFLIVS
jgi:undecaprenyl-diphosphatase